MIRKRAKGLRRGQPCRTSSNRLGQSRRVVSRAANARVLDSSGRWWDCPVVKVMTVSFEKLQRDKRRARLRDTRRLARGEVTPEQLEVVPMGARITIQDFCQTLERYYGK